MARVRTAKSSGIDIFGILGNLVSDVEGPGWPFFRVGFLLLLFIFVVYNKLNM